MDPHRLPVDAASLAKAVEQVPKIRTFCKNIAVFVHELEPDAAKDGTACQAHQRAAIFRRQDFGMRLNSFLICRPGAASACQTCFAAALAPLVALWLLRLYWTIAIVHIASQPLAGAIGARLHFRGRAAGSTSKTCVRSSLIRIADSANRKLDCLAFAVPYLACWGYR